MVQMVNSRVKRLPLQIAEDDFSFDPSLNAALSLWGLHENGWRQAQKDTERQSLQDRVAEVKKNGATQSVQNHAANRQLEPMPDLDLPASGNLEDVQEARQHCNDAHNGENVQDAEAAHGRDAPNTTAT
jgi:hypothetical protein